MLNSPEEVADLLQGSVLDGRLARSISIPGEQDLAIAVSCDPDGVLAAWQCLRDVLDQTERWPVVVAGWDGPIGSDEFSRFPFDHGAGGDTSVQGILARAEMIDSNDVLADLARIDDARDPFEDLEPFELSRTMDFTGSAPTADDIRRALGPRPTRAQLDRWLLDWEEAHGSGHLEAWTYLDWFEPEDMDTAVILLPTPHSWQVPAYLSFFGAEGPGGAENLVQRVANCTRVSWGVLGRV